MRLCDDVNETLAGAGTVSFLDCDAYDVEGTSLRILGCTLWSDVSDEARDNVGSSLNDYVSISVARGSGAKSKATVDDTNSWHQLELAWLQNEMQRAEGDGKRVIVLTHHAPTFHCTSAPGHRSEPPNFINYAFATRLEYMLKAPVLTWLFGHSHWSSWQQFCVADQTWNHMSGTAEGGQAYAAELERCPCFLGDHVLVASNQLCYTHILEHKSGRCHPFMALHCDTNGSKACLRCDGPASLPAAPNGLPADAVRLPAIPAGADTEPERVAEVPDTSVAAADASPKSAAAVGCLTLEELKDRTVWQAKCVEATKREEYLSDDAFQTLFGVSKADFAKLPKWKRDSEKKLHGLF